MNHSVRVGTHIIGKITVTIKRAPVSKLMEGVLNPLALSLASCLDGEAPPAETSQVPPSLGRFFTGKNGDEIRQKSRAKTPGQRQSGIAEEGRREN